MGVRRMLAVKTPRKIIMQNIKIVLCSPQASELGEGVVAPKALQFQATKALNSAETHRRSLSVLAKVPLLFWVSVIGRRCRQHAHQSIDKRIGKKISARTAKWFFLPNVMADRCTTHTHRQIHSRAEGCLI